MTGQLDLEFVGIDKLPEIINDYWTTYYEISNDHLSESLDVLDEYLSQMVGDLYFLVEFPYVEKTYRNTYYHYFSSKHHQFARNSIRLSVFNTSVSEEDFQTSEKFKELLNRESYLGFITLRPTFPKVIGRSVLSAKAAPIHSRHVCEAAFDASIKSIKTRAIGFPHLSQDREYLTCAEATIWSMMEYFGTKYSEYNSVTPSDIKAITSGKSNERVTPSKGLDVAQISYTLKEFGLGVRVYHKEDSANSFDFNTVLRTYIESRIPIVATLEGDEIGHAMIIVGRAAFTMKEFLEQRKDVEQTVTVSYKMEGGSSVERNVTFVDLASMNMDCLVMDDNYAPYQKLKLTNLTEHYVDENGDPLSKWDGCKLKYFIAPLHKKVYLDAESAKLYSTQIILENLCAAENEDMLGNLLINTFLVSSSTYKQYVAFNGTMHEDLRGIILGTTMPKFVWVTEFGNPESMDEQDAGLGGEAYGLLILDATEPKSPRLLFLYSNNVLNYFDSDRTYIEKINVPSHPFKMFATQPLAKWS